MTPETLTFTFFIFTFEVFLASTEISPFVVFTVPPIIPALVLEAKSTSLTPTLPAPIPTVTVTFDKLSSLSFPLPFILDSALTLIFPEVVRLPFISVIEPVLVPAAIGVLGTYWESILLITSSILLSFSD